MYQTVRISRWALGAAIGAFGIAILFFFVGLGQGLGGDSSGSGVLIALAEGCLLLSILANAAAFLFALIGYRRGDSNLPWIVASVSGFGILVTVVWLAYAIFASIASD